MKVKKGFDFMDYNKVIALVKEAKKFISQDNIDNVKMKGEADFVTVVDTNISDFLKNELHALYPNIGFFSEEEDGKLEEDCWILDPIDGTTNLVYGYNMSSISLAHYVHGQGVVFGVVYQPFTNELFTAIKGEGAYLNGTKRLSVSNRPFNRAIIEFGSGATHKENAEENFKIALSLFKECVDIRRICSTALVLCFIADGRIDGYFEKIIKPWDIAAGSLFVEEAGGKMTDYNGNPIDFTNKKTTIIVSNGLIHEKVVSKITEIVG